MKLLSTFLCMAMLPGSLQTSTTVQPLLECSNFVDVVVVADASASIAVEFDRVKDAVLAFINTVTANNPNIRIGLVFYNNNVVTEPLSRNEAQLGTFVENQMSSSGSTRTAEGLRAAIDMLQRRTEKYPANIVVITDGISQSPSDTKTASQSALANGYTVYAVGVRVDETYLTELNDMTGNPNRIYRLESSFEIAQTVADLGRSICAWTVCSACTTEYGSKHVSHPTRCDKYYQCERRGNLVNAYEKNCPVGLLWHKTKMTCVRVQAALLDDRSGCSYCRGLTRFSPSENRPIGDNCEIYYTCTEDARGRNLDISCCPVGQSFDLSSSSCQTPGLGFPTCDAKRYKDPVSCRRYHQCDISRLLEPRCCASGQIFNDNTGSCEASTSCRGDCLTAVELNCDDLQINTLDKCSFIMTNSEGVSWDIRCASGSSFSKPDCRCILDDECIVPTSADCKPDILVTFNEAHENNQGFSESARFRWIDAKDVTYDDTTGSAYLNGTTRLKIPFYSNNEMAFEEVLFFRLSVKDDFLNGNPRQSPMMVLTNRGCGLSDVGTDSSVSISMVPYVRDEGSDKIGSVTFSVRTEEGDASVSVEYVSGNPNEWKELTLRVSPSLLEGRVERYQRDASNNRLNVVAKSDSTSVPAGRVLTSDCGLRIGQDRNSNFKAFVEYVMFYTTCRHVVPEVDAPNPPEIQ